MTTGRRGSRTVAAGLSVALLAVLLLPASAPATLPGANGKIVFIDGGSFHTILADGTGLTPIAGTAGLNQPAWSPDGTKIAYLHPTNDVGVMNADGSGQVLLTTDGAADQDPAWSLDGTKIAFASARNGNSDIFVMNADGSGQVPLTTDAGGDTQPEFSPDGSQIAFRSTRSGDAQIWVMDADGSGQHQVTTIGESAGHPSWSPNGAQITFDIDDGQSVDVLVRNADGSGTDTPLTDNATSAFSNDSADFSPDGTTIAFRSNHVTGAGLPPFPAPNSGEVWLMNADGSDERQLTTAGGDSPDWLTIPVAAPDPVPDPVPDPDPDPPPDTTPPSISIAVADGKLKLNTKGKPGELNLNPRGKGILVLGCSADEASPPCTGKLKLTTAKKIKTKQGKKEIQLAKFDFELGAGEKKRFRVQLKKEILKLVEKEPSARDALIGVVVSDAAGNSAKVTAAVTVTPA